MSIFGRLHWPTKSEIAFFIEDKTIMRQRFYLISYVVLIVSLLLPAYIGRQQEPMDIGDTKVGTENPVGDNNVSVKLLSAKYNPSKNIVEMNFKASGADEFQTFTGNELKFNGATGNGKAKMTTIPTLNNQWTVRFSNLEQKFGGIEVMAISTAPSDPTQSNGDNQKPTFSATQKHLKHDAKLSFSSPRKVALLAVSDEITHQEQSLAKKKQQLKKTKKSIDFKQKQIDTIQATTDIMTQSEKDKAADTVGNLKEEIASSQDFVHEYEADIKSKQTNLEQLRHKEELITSGDYEQSSAIKTVTVGPKKSD